MAPLLAADGSLSRASPAVRRRGAPVGRRLVRESASAQSAVVGPRTPLKITSSPRHDFSGGVCNSIFCDFSSASAPELMAWPPAAGITHQSVHRDSADVFERQPSKRMDRLSEFQAGNLASAKSSARRMGSPPRGEILYNAPVGAASSREPVQ